MVFELAPEEKQVSQVAKIKVIGVGGAGGNAVNRMIAAGLEGVEFIAVNTDHQMLGMNSAPTKIRVGTNLTRGLGAGGDPEMGKRATEDDKALIAEVLENTDMLFITAGMGGGTGTGSAPVIAKIARDMNVLTVAVVTKPFSFEGRNRNKNADLGLEELKEVVDTLIVIPNEKLLTLVDRDTPFDAAFAKADEVLLHATQGISELITKEGLINLDFADVSSVLSNVGGDALMGTGIASGEGRAIEAARKAISCPLMEDVSITGSKGVLINISGDPSLALAEAAEAARLISEQAGADADIFFGAVIDENLQDEVRITVIAAGFVNKQKQQKLTTRRSYTDRISSSMDSIFEAPRENQERVAEPSHSYSDSYEEDTQDTMAEVPEPVMAGVGEHEESASDSSMPTFVSAPGRQDDCEPEDTYVQQSSRPKRRESAGLMDFSSDDYDTPAFLRRRKVSGN